MNPVMATGLPGIFHVLGDVAVAIRKTTFNLELFDRSKQAFIFNSPFAFGLVEPGIKSSTLDFQCAAHGDN